MQEKSKKLSNGLTTEQVERAKEILAQVNIAKIAKQQGVKVSTIYNVLRDQSPRVDLLSKVLSKAKAIVRNKEKVLKALPV